MTSKFVLNTTTEVCSYSLQYTICNDTDNRIDAWVYSVHIKAHHDMTSPLCLARREPGSNVTAVADALNGAETLTRG